MKNDFGDMTMRVCKQSSAARSAVRRSGALLRGAATLLIAITASLVEAAVIEDIRFASLPNDVTEIRLDFDGPAPEPAGYTIDQPARIAIDLMNATSALDSKYHTLGTGNTRSVTVVEAADRTRMIINLTELVGYETTVNGDSLIVRVGASVAGGSARSLAAASRPAERLIAAASEVTEIDFRRGDQGEGQVIIRLTNPKAPLDVRGEGSDIRVEIGGTTVPEALRRRLDVTDFATPVELIDTIEESGRAVITIRPTGEYEYLAYQADEVVTVNIRPINPDAPGVERADNVFRYKGEKLSLNFQDIEVRSVLQLIADFTDLNLVASDTVSGRITLRLQNVPWDQALDIILRNKGLDKRRAGNVLMVAPAAEIAAREKQELDNRRQIQELAPLRTEFIQVLYADAQQLVNLFQTAGEGGEAGLLSERGSVIVDERTNSIIISETADKIVEFRRLLQQLDIPVRQVLIEARIVNANANFSETLGIRWGGAATRQTGGSFVSIASTVDDSQAIRTGAANGETAILETPVVDLAAPSGTTNFTVGLTGRDYLLDLELSALATEGNGEIVARPKVITADQQTATIESGTQIPFQEATSAGATSTSFQDAVLSLEVTPQITPDNRIIMDLQVNQDEVGQIFNGVPSIDTNAVSTQVLVDNGQTIVLGGIFRNTSNRSVDKTPFLGDLPYVGRLFRRTIENQDKRELLIFITPRIIDDALTRR
ncbi:MAG: type IV pilus secretin PilQ [Pseudomonadota bacterium]|nr:type IV pilus secretin PilQ [Pseudomonadota bacterium]